VERVDLCAYGIRWPLIERQGFDSRIKNGINIMKGYMEDGNFSRGSEIITAEGSSCLLGNLDGTSKPLYGPLTCSIPMPENMDAASTTGSIAYCPAGNYRRLAMTTTPTILGSSQIIFARYAHAPQGELQRHCLNASFASGSHLTGRDQRPAQDGMRTHEAPASRWTGDKDEVEEYMVFAMEMRRRVRSSSRSSPASILGRNFSYRES